MVGVSLETMIYVVGLVLTVGALGGLAWTGAAELRVRNMRRSRLAGVATGGQAAGSTANCSRR